MKTIEEAAKEQANALKTNLNKLIMALQIAYIKVPIIVDCKFNDIESKINNHFGTGYFCGSEYCVQENDSNTIVSKIFEQNKLIDKLKEQIK